MSIHEALLSVEWEKMLVPGLSVLEMFLRGTLIYLGIFVLLRVFRRPTGQLTIADVLLITISADAAQNAMAGDYDSVSSGFVLIGTIVFWDRTIDYLAYRWPWFARLAEPPPVILIENGVVQQAALRNQKITHDELLSHLREHGVERPDEAKRCLLESDGKISVLEFE